MTGTKVALLIGGVYLLSRGGLAKALTTATPGQQPKATQQAPPPAKGTGAPAGQGGSSTAGRGGDPKLGGGSSNIFSIDELFPNFNGPSVIDQMLADQNAGTDVPAPSLTDFIDPSAQQTNDVLGSLIGPANNSVPQFAGEIDPETGLAIDPGADIFGPEVVDMTEQVNMNSTIQGSLPDSPDLSPELAPDSQEEFLF
jgi:hypothetical protein